MPEIQKLEYMYEMKGLLFQPCFPHKGQELQTTDNEL